ncbi:hypothetical protein KEU06_08950 [Pseudaminobacter sp. 19-2017]|uniref:Uncharacterized protein n=1 Tax=Pseudaminobacter soli (ex Zhang et al. 2022) TaxID=2831468 RepID=A0A942I7V3_9HYPH|nr:hypothetical protein [Pseudaminobacter soli]MBS3648755.1 hypothetical protein [Pseudaminobacter soli]
MNAFFALAFWLTMLASWLTHFYVSIVDDRIALLFLGTFVPPIGWLHGLGVWVGLF